MFFSQSFIEYAVSVACGKHLFHAWLCMKLTFISILRYQRTLGPIRIRSQGCHVRRPFNSVLCSFPKKYLSSANTSTKDSQRDVETDSEHLEFYTVTTAQGDRTQPLPTPSECIVSSPNGVAQQNEAGEEEEVQLSPQIQAQDRQSTNAAERVANPSPENMGETHSQNDSKGDDEKPNMTKFTAVVHPITMSRNTTIAMVQTLRAVRESGLPDKVNLSTERRSEQRHSSSSRASLQHLKRLSQEYRKGRTRKSESRYQELLKERMKLPIQAPYTKNKILESLQTNDVLVLVSETGSGKSTQLPQQILESQIAKGSGAFCNVICSQPRRLAAVSVARRVADEQQCHLGRDGHVGFSVRFRPEMATEPGSINYVTNGIMLKALNEEPLDTMMKYSHIIIDEVHERDIVCDLVLVHLRDLLRARRKARQSVPKIILMSATIDAIDFHKYFEEPFDGPALRVNTIEVKGRNHDIQTRMLEDIMPLFEEEDLGHSDMVMLKSATEYLTLEDKFAARHLSPEGELETSLNLNEQLKVDPHAVERAFGPPHELFALTIALALKTPQSEQGDVLVFLPGMGDIEKVERMLQSEPILGLDLKDESKFRVYRLHAALYETNEDVFLPVPAGCRRIVLATNIAQTSVTLPDTLYVIDNGIHKIMKYDAETGQNEFRGVWYDKSSSRQRRGRVGRTRPGHYWALFTQARYESMREKPIPEIQLQEVVGESLSIKSGNPPQALESFLSRTLDPPPVETIQTTISELKKLRMLTEDEDVTPLGHLAAKFPLHPALVRSLVLGVLFRCLEPLLFMASHNRDKTLIYTPKSQREKTKALLHFTDIADDDRFPYLSAFRQMDQARGAGDATKLSELDALHVKDSVYFEVCNVARQLCDLLHEYGVMPKLNRGGSVFQILPSYTNANANSTNVIKALALSIQYSKLAVFHGDRKCWATEKGFCNISPFSLNSSSQLELLGRHMHKRAAGEVVSYSIILDNDTTTEPILAETSSVTPLMAMLFGGPVKMIGKNIIEIDGWLKYEIKPYEEEHPTDSVAIDIQNVAELVIEFRKALERFLQLACADIGSDVGFFHYRPDSSGVLQQSVSYLAEYNDVAKAFASGLRAIFDADNAHWDHYTHLSKQALERTSVALESLELKRERRAHHGALAR